MFKRTPDKSLRLPLTPLIDCTFLLIIFFLLATQLAGRELPKLALPSPQEPSPSVLPTDVKQLNHVTVNVLTQYGGRTADRDPNLSRLASRYQVGVDVVEVGQADAMATLTGVLGSRRAQAESRGVIRYGDVETVMQAASDAGIAMMSLTAKAEDDSKGPGTEEQ